MKSGKAYLSILTFAILMVCVLYSANQDVVRIYNPSNDVVYEAAFNTSDIAEFKKVYGIENFKKEGFVVTREEIENEFPTRAWVALSVCVPLAMIFFVVFIVKVFRDVFQPGKEDDVSSKEGRQPADFDETKFEN